MIAEGYLEGHQGSGTIVADGIQELKNPLNHAGIAGNPSKNKLNQTDDINTIGNRNKTDKTANTESIEYSGKVHHKEKYKNTGILQNTGKFLEYWRISKH